MQTYRTSEVALKTQVHPNTVRLYEKLNFISKAKRSENGYRIFTDLHIYQMKLARLGLKTELLHHGLRNQVLSILRLSSDYNMYGALEAVKAYEHMLEEEILFARKAIESVESLFEGHSSYEPLMLKRKEASLHLGLTIDTLRNWELNGLITTKRTINGYRCYDEQDIQRLLVIRTLRSSNYSLMAILRSLNHLENDRTANVEKLLNTPSKNEDLISVCDQLLVSLSAAADDAKSMKQLLKMMNPPLYHQSLKTG